MTLIFPYSVLLLLKSQKINVKIIKFDKFCWFDVIRIALIYSTEKFASLLLSPALLYKTIFSFILILGCTTIAVIFSVDFVQLTFSRGLLPIKIITNIRAGKNKDFPRDKSFKLPSEERII